MLVTTVLNFLLNFHICTPTYPGSTETVYSAVIKGNDHKSPAICPNDHYLIDCMLNDEPNESIPNLNKLTDGLIIPDSTICSVQAYSEIPVQAKAICRTKDAGANYEAKTVTIPNSKSGSLECESDSRHMQVCVIQTHWGIHGIEGADATTGKVPVADGKSCSLTSCPRTNCVLYAICSSQLPFKGLLTTGVNFFPTYNNEVEMHVGECTITGLSPSENTALQITPRYGAGTPCLFQFTSDTFSAGNCDSGSSDYQFEGTAEGVKVSYFGIETAEFVCEAGVMDTTNSGAGHQSVSEEFQVHERRLLSFEALRWKISYDEPVGYEGGIPYFESQPKSVKFKVLGDEGFPVIDTSTISLTISFANEDSSVSCVGLIWSPVLTEVDWSGCVGGITSRTVLSVVGGLINFNTESGIDGHLSLFSVYDKPRFPVIVYPKCGAGSYINGNECAACERGVREDTQNQLFGCQACDVGRCPSENRVACVDRPPGQFSMLGWKCEDCPGGSRPTDDGSSCEPCEAGFYSGGGTAECIPCADSYFAPAPGFTECALCGGVVYDNKCSACPPGEGKLLNPDTKTEECAACPAGKASSQGACEACLPGTNQPQSGQIECLSCPIGTYQENQVAVECKPCLASEGKYSDTERSSTCKMIEPGYEVLKDGSGNGINSAPCQPGSYAAQAVTGWACRPCNTDKGEYTDLSQQSSCKMVPPGYFLLENDGTVSVESCEPGTYRGPESTVFTECVTCDAATGYYQDQMSQDQCEKVAPGKMILIDDHGLPTSVVECSIGTKRSESDTSVFTECVPCDGTRGFYQDEIGQPACKSVVPGKYIIVDDGSGLPVGVGECEAGSKRSNTDNYFECVLCDGVKGEYASTAGADSCAIVPPGSYTIVEVTGTKSYGQCEIGTARSDQFYIEGSKKFTECRKCESGFYQNRPNQPTCDPVPTGNKSINDGRDIEECPAGHKEVKGACMPCIPELGEFQTKPGKNYCERVQPGYSKPDLPEQEPILCTKGTVSNYLFECMACNAEQGEYQDKDGQSFCQIVDPGHELAIDESTGLPANDQKPVKCRKGTYSKGSSKTCKQCDRDRKEYQNEEGATYCKICSRGKVHEGAIVCEGLGCKEESILKIELSDKPFVFSETAAGETLIIPCNPDNLSAVSDKIYRHCVYDEIEYTAYWSLPNFGMCPTAKTEKINDLNSKMEVLQSPENLSTLTSSDLAVEFEKLSEDFDAISADDNNETEVKMTARDVSDVTNALLAVESVITMDTNQVTGDATPEELAAMKEATKKVKKSTINTIEKVAESGEDTLKTVDNSHKISILHSVEALSDSMEDDEEPIVAKRLVVKKLPKVTTPGEDIALPLPSDLEEDEAPKLSLGNMESTGASVAVFSESAKDLFPDPTDGDEDDEEEEAEQSAVAMKPKVNKTLNSCVVSLKFNNVDKVDFSLRLKANYSRDGDQKGKRLERKCSFLNTATQKWSSKGCNTTVVEGTSDLKCTCDHNTSFAILLSISDITDNSQEHATLIMFCINITFLVLTFLAIAPFPKYRTRRLVVLQTQLVLSLIVANIGFQCLSRVPDFRVTIDMYGSPTFGLNVPCVIGVILVQYLFLVVMAWMTCCAYTLHGKIVDAVKTFGKTDKFYVHKCVIICWVLPILLPGSAFMTSELMSNSEGAQALELPYIASGAINGTDCWVAAPWKWASFMIPMYLCLLLNCTVFVMIVRVLIRAANSGSSNAALGKQVKGALTIAVTVGVPWIVAILSFEPLAAIGQWAFIILTGLQGPCMFVVFVVLQEEVLGTLLQPLGLKVPEILQSPKSTSAKKSSAAPPTASMAVTKVEADEPAVSTKKEADPPRASDRDNVYCNTAAMKDEEESQGGRSDVGLVKSESQDKDLDDNLYYECTHFPYEPDATSLSSQYPEPVMGEA